MHFMMLGHDLAKGPGRYRSGPIYVHDDESGRVVHEGADADDVPRLMAELTREIGRDTAVDPLVRGAMAHLNLVMIHPFLDGNGRMARALQTLVRSRCGVGEPAFSSIEEWLGRNTGDYYGVLAATGRGRWQPDGDAALWVKFNLRAHHMQAQTTSRRFREAAAIWTALDELAAQHGLPDRVIDELYDATIGFRLRRATYVKRTRIEERTASRDLGRLSDLGLLRPVGETKGRHYVAGPALERMRAERVPARRPLEDPSPGLRAEFVAAQDTPDAGALRVVPLRSWADTAP